jgi:putative ATPase
VLILEARSLLWALDPLEQCPEGGVVIQAASADDQRRLQAQLQVLDSLGRPQLVLGDLPALEQQLERGHRFEWLAARHPFRQLQPQARRLQLQALGRLAAPGAQLRLLFSQPALGPAAALLARPELPPPLRELLEPVAAAESQWIATPPEPSALEQELIALGWQPPSWEQWQEPLELPLSPGLLERWLAAGAPYRQHLGGLLKPRQIEALADGLRPLCGLPLPQRLDLLLSRQQKAPATPGPEA